MIADALAGLNPIGTFPIYQLDQGQPFDLLAPYNLLGAIGYALWLVAYVLVIRKGFKDKTYAIPLIPICLNFTWEFMDSWVLPDEVPAASAANAATARRRASWCRASAS